jgi:RNA polymerase sigma factor (sigma-70 family)
MTTNVIDEKYEDLSTYISLAKKVISKFAGKIYPELRTEMLMNEDAVSDVANAIMCADWKWDPDRIGQHGQGKSKYSYRNQCAIWAIQTYVSKKYKRKPQYSLDNCILNDDKNTYGYFLTDNDSYNPLNILIQEENASNVSATIKSLLEHPHISDKQRKQISMYFFDDMTLNDIGKEYGVTREAVRQNIKKAIDLFKEAANEL